MVDYAEAEFEGLRRLYGSVFSPEWYVHRYPDLQSCDLDLLDHFILQGEAEGRDPNMFFSTGWVTATQGGRVVSGRPFESFLRADIRSGFNPHPCVDMGFLAEAEAGWRTNLEALRDVWSGSYTGDLSDWFSRSEYLEIHSDLTDVDDLEAHFLTFGLFESRRPSRTHRVVRAFEYVRGRYRGLDPVTSFCWSDDDWVVLRVGPSDSVLRQLERQQQLDPRLNAPGAMCHAGLPVYRATDLEIRDLIDVEGLLALVAEGADFVFVIPSIGLGGGEKYMIQLASTLAEEFGARVLVLVANDSQESVDEALRTLRRHELLRVRVASMHELLGRTWKADFVLALLILALAPKSVFVANAEQGFKAISTYGRSLRQVTKLVSAFFSESPRAVGAPYSVRFADQVADHALLLSDNRTVLDTVIARLAPQPSGIKRFVLPQFVEGGSPTRLDAEARLRGARWRRRKSLSVLWVSRWESFKNVGALIEVARKCPTVEITAFGPGQEAATQVPNNLMLRGPMWAPATHDLSAYDCFLFTSQFEGMPNIVLEMVTRGIPVISPRVGGLHETFSDQGIWFYDNGETESATADAITATLLSLESHDFEEASRRCAVAEAELWARHSESQYSKSVAKLLTLLVDSNGAEHE